MTPALMFHSLSLSLPLYADQITLSQQTLVGSEGRGQQLLKFHRWVTQFSSDTQPGGWKGQLLHVHQRK